MRIVQVLTCCLAVAIGTSSAMAATVEVLQGQVSINRGAGFTRVSGVSQAAAGDQVMANANGRAKITYGNGCLLEVEVGSVAVVPADAACVAGVDTTTYVLGGLAVAGGVAAVVLLTKPASP